MPIKSSELAYFDDVLVDCLIDRIDYWAHIRKTGEYKPISGVRDSGVREIVNNAIAQKPLGPLVEQFCSMPAITKFLARFHETSIRSMFEKHVRRYLGMYSPQAPFAVEVTTRYAMHTGRPAEACIVAREQLSAGAEIKFLTGMLADLGEDDEELIRSGSAGDFSIINTSRRSCSSMMLGPARFINHDCQPNAQFISNGRGLMVKALRNIDIGEEVTVQYAPNYFGEMNRECLCASCERENRNGHANAEPDDASTDVDEAEPTMRTDSGSVRVLRQRSRTPETEPSTRKSIVEYYGAYTVLDSSARDTCSNCRVNFKSYIEPYKGKRLQCPRCTRHATLYNSFWPKTKSTPVVLSKLYSRVVTVHKKDNKDVKKERPMNALQRRRLELDRKEKRAAAGPPRKRRKQSAAVPTVVRPTREERAERRRSEPVVA